MTGPSGGPTIHGVYDYWLGGGLHLRADRELAQAIAARRPSAPLRVRAAQGFHLQAARWSAARGISRFVHAGHLTALPPGCNVHDAVREVDPGAQVVYAYRDEEAHAVSGGLLAGERGVSAVLSGQGGFLAEAPVRAMLAAGSPLCVISGLMLHFVPADRAAERIARAAGELPAGSALAASVALTADSPRARDLLRMFTPAPVFRHTAADLQGWLEDAGLKVVDPGVFDVLEPGRPWPGDRGQDPGFIAGVLAVKP